MRAGMKLSWVLAAETGIILILPFPVAGPLPHWRAALAWIALVPLLIALLSPRSEFGWRRAGWNTLLGYVSGILWYGGTCYWIQSTMRLYGNLSSVVSWCVLALFCLFLAIYFALFGFLVTLARRAIGRSGWTLAVVPFLWVAMELACARITSFPWNQLGYSQIDNLLLTRMAPWTGVYGISFVIVAVNCAIAALFLNRRWRTRLVPTIVGIALAIGLQQGTSRKVAPAATSATAVLLQPNLSVAAGNNWFGPAFDLHMQRYAALSENVCHPYFSGLPVAGEAPTESTCPPRGDRKSSIDLIVWPESPAPFEDSDPRLRHWVSALAEDANSPMIVGDVALVHTLGQIGDSFYNSASFVAPNGAFVGRYDKMHLVPFGEYVPFPKLLAFAGGLTKEVGQMTHGKERVVFAVNGHRYGTFICYESIFALEVRKFAKLGADVLVNISDDGWYGDTSAPWQHLNMTRMRAIENDRWLLVDTNSGITAAVDPYGRVTQSLPRHEQSSLAARFGYISAETFYTRHGDLFAWLCAIIAIALAVDGAFHHDPRQA